LYNEGMFKKRIALTETEFRNKRRKWIQIGIVLLCNALFIWALYTGLTVRNYQIKSDKIKSGGIRIVLVTDLHSHIYGNDQHPLIDLVKTQHPDLIALVGDIVDDEEPDTGARLFLEGIKDIAPIYYVSGNHEYWSEKYGEIKSMIESYGVTVVENEREDITVNGIKLRICGVDDPMMFEYTSDPEYLSMRNWDGNEKENEKALFRARFSDLDNSEFNILLAHRPEQIDVYLQYNFDLILSGHTHGGQIRIPPLINGIFAPVQGLFPKYAGGCYDLIDGKTLVVSRGLSFNRFIPRVFNPPEICVIDITGKETEQ
jgi:predicted MPP superfamily phosphohydrolase